MTMAFTPSFVDRLDRFAAGLNKHAVHQESRTDLIIRAVNGMIGGYHVTGK